MLAGLFRSIWFYPAILFLVLVGLSALKISGTSLGIYNTYFNGTASDPNLITGIPRQIRSDEWVVNTQMTFAQKNNNFNRMNNNIGAGQDMSVVLDAPYREWSQIFKPHNWAFFVLPFDNAYAFKWWMPAFLLIISSYFFVLAVLPKKKLLAILLSLVLIFSAFVQWWYQYGTLGSLYYSLFIATAFLYMLDVKGLRGTMAWGVFMSYLLVCFALITYPPFQIPCMLIVAVFALGQLIVRRGHKDKKEILQKLGILATSAIIACGIIAFFIFTRLGAVNALTNTTYPANRIVTSGGFDFTHLLSGNLGYQFLDNTRALAYQPVTGVPSNQSETSNFILLLPFLVFPGAIILYGDFKRRKYDWPLIFITIFFLYILAWMLIPHLNWLGKPLLLHKVPHVRLLIGLGLLNFLYIVLIIKRLTNKNFPIIFTKHFSIIFALGVFLIELIIGHTASERSPGFIGDYRVIAFALPIPVIIYMILRKRFELAALGLAAFSIFTSFSVNPLYYGTGFISSSQLSEAIKSSSEKRTGRWVIEPTYLENFAIANGVASLSGVYTYPQLSLWKGVSSTDDDNLYNRYAHITFNIDRQPNKFVATRPELPGMDHISITSEPCSDFFREKYVRFILTDTPLMDSDPCLELVSKVSYPAHTYYIYHIFD